MMVSGSGSHPKLSKDGYARAGRWGWHQPCDSQHTDQGRVSRKQPLAEDFRGDARSGRSCSAAGAQSRGQYVLCWSTGNVPSPAQGTHPSSAAVLRARH